MEVSNFFWPEVSEILVVGALLALLALACYIAGKAYRNSTKREGKK